ncbi:fasciclin domain-containing protein [Caulobacter sp. DWR2-3-1b2]|uniref:fasciclin domain-containing protein n=1 Tax=unclassified Caulobacter TaxID=2648921 RepID=UPI0019B6AFA4|nr:fasciclin domain-containing protein [Caulobacter sp.]
MKTTLLLAAVGALTLSAAPTFAHVAAQMKPTPMAHEKTVMVGGAAMYPSKTIVQNALNSKDHTTLVAAVKAAGLVDTLSGPGPFTVFAPTNAAFAKLPAGTVETLIKPENKATLTKILTYHVVAGRMTAANLKANAKAHGGKAMLTTVQGEKLTVSKAGRGWKVTDAKGGSAMITVPDVMQSNGVIHVVDTVLMP